MSKTWPRIENVGKVITNYYKFYFDENTLLTRIAKILREYYPSLANKKDVTHTENYVFFKGWLNRINDYLGVKIDES